MNRPLVAALATMITIVPLAAWAQQGHEGLVEVQSPRADAVYLLPDVDFRPYTKVMLDRTEVSFRRNWQRNYNMSAPLGRRVNNEDAARAAEQVRSGFEEIFARAYREAGYQVVTEPGPDVLRLRTGVVNLYVTAPDQMSAGRSRVYAVDAGEATLVIEARESQTGALLGRVFDREAAGDTTGGLRTSVSNRADFEALFRRWATLSVRGLDELKARSPVAAAAPGR